jgi:hypothetical protein
VEFKLNATTTAHKVQKRKILAPSQTQIHKKNHCKLIEEKKPRGKRKREEEQEAAEDRP